MRRFFTFLVFLLALVSASFAWADVAPDARAKAEQLKAAADTQMDELHFADALKGYQDAYALNPDPKLLYNMGRARAALDDYPGAVADLERFKREAPPDLKAKVPQLDEIIDGFRKKTTTVTVSSNVDGARLLVNAKAIGTTPFHGPIVVNAGTVDVELSADTYSTDKRQVVLPAGGTIALDFTLQKADVAGILIVRSKPSSDTSAVDGKKYGGTPLELSLPPGSHTISLSRDGYRDIDTQAVLGRGERKVVDLTFEKSPGIASRWWFWTIVGVVVIGAAVTATVLALTLERSPTAGSIPPGIIKGP